MSNSSDADYKAIFSHPEMVIDVIKGFAPGPWLANIDFSKLEPFKSSFISPSENQQQRHSDLIWRVRCQGSWVYVYLLFEFQSTIDQFMAIRMMVYVGLLYQELIKTKEFGPNEKLPFVLPIVLYNGSPLWHAPLATQALIGDAPEGFEHHVPRLTYFLIDEGSYGTEELMKQENLAAAIFLIETQTTMEGLHNALDKVLKWPDSEKHPVLCTAIARLADRIIRKRMPEAMTRPEQIHDLKGVVSMLTENVERIATERETQGREQGIEQGVKLGNAAMFKAMVAIRFGPLPDTILARIDEASESQLLKWGEQMFVAASLEAVFGKI